MKIPKIKGKSTDRTAFGVTLLGTVCETNLTLYFITNATAYKLSGPALCCLPIVNFELGFKSVTRDTLKNINHHCAIEIKKNLKRGPVSFAFFFLDKPHIRVVNNEMVLLHNYQRYH